MKSTFHSSLHHIHRNKKLKGIWMLIVKKIMKGYRSKHAIALISGPFLFLIYLYVQRFKSYMHVESYAWAFLIPFLQILLILFIQNIYTIIWRPRQILISIPFPVSVSNLKMETIWKGDLYTGKDRQDPYNHILSIFCLLHGGPASY